MLQGNKLNLSIVIPVFNEDRYLEKLFDQLKKFFNKDDIEIIIIDDGSTDNSHIIIENFKKKKILNLILVVLN